MEYQKEEFGIDLVNAMILVGQRQAIDAAMRRLSECARPNPDMLQWLMNANRGVIQKLANVDHPLAKFALSAKLQVRVAGAEPVDINDVVVPTPSTEPANGTEGKDG